MEHRRVLADLGIDIRFSDDGDNRVASVLRGEMVTVEVQVQDLRDAGATPVGVIGLPINAAWDETILNVQGTIEESADLPIGNALLTNRFPLRRVLIGVVPNAGPFDGTAASPIDTFNLRGLGAGSLPALGDGEAIGVSMPETFATLQFEATQNTATTFFTVGLDGAMAFTDGDFLRDVVGLNATSVVAPDQSPNTVTAPLAVVGGSISGVKFNDIDGDGVQDPGELPVTGVTIQLDPVADGLPTLESMTGDDGRYQFSDLAAGDYVVREVVREGFRVTLPAGNQYNVTLNQQNQNPDDLHFGNQVIPPLTSSVSGMKFDDLDGDGIMDAGEPAKPGITIMLVSPTGEVDARSTTTDDEGRFRFDDVLAGSYMVGEVLPQRHVQTTPGDGFDIVVTPPAPVTDLVFGNFELTDLGGVKFEDIDDDGVRDDGERPLSGVTIQLDLDDDGTVDRTAVTDDAGQYQFINVGPGSHRLTEIVPDGFRPTVPSADGIVVNNRSGASRTDLNFGNQLEPVVPVEPVDGSLNGRVFVDGDFDGVVDPGEFGLPGVTVQLMGTSDAGIAISRSTLTTADGGYRFASLPAGTYRVIQTQPGNYANGSITRGTMLPSGETRGTEVGFNEFRDVILGENETAIDFHFGESLLNVTKRMFLASTDVRGELTDNAGQSRRTIRGTSGNDTIVVDLRAEGMVRVEINSVVTDVSGADARYVLVDGRGGSDIVTVLGGTADEHFVAGPLSSTAATTVQSVGIFGAEQIRFVGGGGDDTGVLRDSVGADDLFAADDAVAMITADGVRIGMVDVPMVQAISAIDGPPDNASIEAIDFTLQLAGDWRS